MKKILLVIAIVLICAALCVFCYVFTSIGTGQSMLNDQQRANLCEELKEKDYSAEGKFKESANVSDIKILGITGDDTNMTVYGFFSEGLYVKYKDNAYCISGGTYELMADITVDGDSVKVNKVYGDGVSSESTIKEMPFRYRTKVSVSNRDGSAYTGMLNKVNSKAEEALGVPVDKKYTLMIEGDKFQIYDIDSKGNTEIKYEGKRGEL